MSDRTRHVEIATVFLKLGIIGFGGPAAHIAMMEDEVVRRRKWIREEEFLDLLGATNLIPGPNSTEMAMHLGMQRGGFRGFLIAGACFILPAVIITAIFAYLYQLYSSLPVIQPAVEGIKAAIISVVVVTVIRLGRRALKSIPLGVIGVLAGAFVLAGFNEIIVLFGAGLVGILLAVSTSRSSMRSLVPPIFLHVFYGAFIQFEFRLFWVFLKVGSILYGSGYVLFAFLDAELVSRGWLSKAQLLDAIAVGKVTPGPVFSSATFIGWQIAGPGGALAATAGIFLPSFIFVWLLNPLIPRLRKSALMGSFLDAVNIASIAIILSIMLEMGMQSLDSWRTVAIALVSLLLVAVAPRLNSALIVAGGALAGYLLGLMN